MKNRLFLLSCLLLPSLAYAAPKVGATPEFFGFLGALFLAGVGTSFTPCVYPLIGVTVGIFGARQAQSKLRAFSLSLAYVFGIQATFIGVGVFSALAGQALGTLLANPYVNLGLAVVFVGFALSYFGMYELDLPESLKQRLNEVGGGGSYKGAFAMGLVGGIIAAPCTGPALASLATSVGASQDVWLGIWGFSAFGFGLGLLFLLVGTFSSLALPRGGAWMDGVKSFLGIVILVLAVYYAQNTISLVRIKSDQTWMVGLGAGLVVLGLAIGAVHLSVYGTTVQKIRKGIGVLLCTAGGHIMVGWLLYIPSAIPFQTGNAEASLATAKSEGRPAFVDFGAEWCVACKELEKNVFTQEDILRESRRFAPIRIDCTNEDEPNCAGMVAKYKVPGFPRVLFFDSTGALQDQLTVQGEVSIEDFLSRMKQVR